MHNQYNTITILNISRYPITISTFHYKWYRIINGRTKPDACPQPTPESWHFSEQNPMIMPFYIILFLGGWQMTLYVYCLTVWQSKPKTIPVYILSQGARRFIPCIYLTFQIKSIFYTLLHIVWGSGKFIPCSCVICTLCWWERDLTIVVKWFIMSCWVNVRFYG